MADGGPSWKDIPGEHYMKGSGSWPTERYIEEFVVAVEKFPEFGMLYLNVVIDTLKNNYRVQLGPATPIRADQWCAMKTQASPYQLPTPGGSIYDSGWQAAG